MAIRIIKKIDASKETLFVKHQPVNPAKTVQTWVEDLRSKKLKEREIAEQFWGIGAFRK